MGWAKGKGLGREEQGDLEPIRLKYKNDAEGVGYEVKDDQWVSHREEFNNILSALNGNEIPIEGAEPIPIKSLEVRSKSSKSRVHYHKFTRGKDLSRYSASDMACILGKRANAEINQVKEEIKKKEPIESSNGSVEHLHGVTTIQRGSIQEYFASKMAAVKEKQLGYHANGEQNASLNDSSNVEKRVRINEDLNIVKEFCSKEKILKSNQMTGRIMWMITSKFGYCLLEIKQKINSSLLFLFPEIVEEIGTKKKKKSKIKLEECNDDVPSEPLPIIEEVLDNLETKKKKKKNKGQIEEVIPEPVIEAEPIKIKKSKKRKIGEVNGEPEIIQNGKDDANTQPKKKKSKKQEEEQPVEVIEPKVKKSKKDETLEAVNELVQMKEEPTIKKKKKKNKKNEEPPPTEKYTKMENSFIENEQVDMIQNNVVETEQPPKKKKKKNKKGDDEVPETFRKIEEIEFELKVAEKFNSELADEVGSIQSDVDVRVSKKNKKNKKDVIETLETSVQEDKAIQDAQVSSTKDRSKKRRASDVTEKVVTVNVKEEQQEEQSTKEKKKDKKNIDKKVCSANQLTCEADAKPDDAQKELGDSRIKDMSTILSEGNAETQGGKNFNILENLQLSNGPDRLSQKVNRRLMRAQFDQFVGKYNVVIILKEQFFLNLFSFRIQLTQHNRLWIF